MSLTSLAEDCGPLFPSSVGSSPGWDSGLRVGSLLVASLAGSEAYGCADFVGVGVCSTTPTSHPYSIDSSSVLMDRLDC